MWKHSNSLQLKEGEIRDSDGWLRQIRNESASAPVRPNPEIPGFDFDSVKK